MSSVNLTGTSQGLDQYFQSLATTTSPSTDSLTSALNANATATQGTPPHHHHHGGGTFKNIQQAVLSALDSSDGSTDPNTTVQNAILGVLKGNTPTDADGDSDSSGAASSSSRATGSNGVTSPQDFFQALQKYGVTPDQFKKDLQGALQQSGGNSDLTGLLVDAIA